MPVSASKYVSVTIMRRRNALGMNQGDLAKRLGVSRQTIISWENAIHAPAARHLPALVEVLGGDATDYIWSEHDYELQAGAERVREQMRALWEDFLAELG